MKCYVQGHTGILVAEAEPETGLWPLLHHFFISCCLSLCYPCVYSNLYVIQFLVSQVFSSNFKGMVFYLLGLYCTETNYYCSMAVGEF